MPPYVKDFQYEKVAPPRSLGDVPRFLRELFGGFFGRLFYVFRLVWETGPATLFFMLFFALFDGVMPVVSALISRSILNRLQVNFGEPESVGSFLASQVFVLLLCFFLWRLLHTVVARVHTTVIRITGEQVVRHVRLKIMYKARELDVAAYDLPSFYEKLENANREAGNRPVQIISSLCTMLSAVVSLVSYLIILFRVPGMWWAAIVIAVTSVPAAIINFTYRRRNFRYMRKRSYERRQMNYYADLMVNKDYVREIRLYDLSDTFAKKYDAAFGQYFTGLRRMLFEESMWSVGTSVLSTVVNCLFFAMIAFMVWQGKLMIGDYTLLTGALSSVATSLTQLIGVTATIYEGTLFIDNLLSFLREKQTVVPTVTPPRTVCHGKAHTIVFEDVGFHYPGSEREVLSHINLTLRPGENLVLVGLNGAGKTTLLKLLMRLYDPTSGRILLDGADLREYDVRDLYRMYGCIFQDFGRYAESAGDNIRFGEIAKTPAPGEVERAAESSGAATFIERLPRRYDTPLMRVFEQDGVELSGGQWQKLAIARAFYSDRDVLILDEPTAALDPLAEQEIYNQFDRLRQGRTTVFVSHRLSCATSASKIIVLEYGRLIEEGTHAELMARGGRYAELFETQAKRYKTTEDGALPDDAAGTGGAPAGEH